MKIVVTGGSGNIGRAVVQHLASAGHAVLTLDRRRPRDGRAGEFAYCDLARRDVLELHLARFAPEALCHLAEIPDARRLPEAEVYAANAAATGTLFQTAAEMGVRRVAYASTVQVYAQFGRYDDARPAPAPAALPMTEAEPTRPNNGYGAQKVGAEAYLGALAGRFDTTAAALRIPGCRDFLGSDWLGHAFRDAGRYSRGDRDGALHELGAWLDSADCASAFAACVAWEGAAPWAGFEAFHVAADSPWRTPDSPPTRDRLAATFPGGPPLPGDFPEHGAPYDSTKLRRLTGWHPAVSIEDLWQKAGIVEGGEVLS